MKLTNKQITETLSNIPSGEVVTLIYQSELPLKAASKKEGHSIIKIAKVDALIGLNYSQLPEVQAFRAKRLQEGFVSSKNYTNNYEEQVPNRVYYNTNTGKTYARFISRREFENKHFYIVDGELVEHLNEEQKALVIDSHWKPSNKTEEEQNLPIQQNISFENIMYINGVGENNYFN